MVAGMADAEVAVFVGKAHGHGGAVVLTPPGIDVPVLKHVVGHAALVSDEYHDAGVSFLLRNSSTEEVISTRPVSGS